jgi:hypothetical protein
VAKDKWRCTRETEDEMQGRTAYVTVDKNRTQVTDEKQKESKGQREIEEVVISI